jgi:hypothetical protein
METRYQLRHSPVRKRLPYCLPGSTVTPDPYSRCVAKEHPSVIGARAEAAIASALARAGFDVYLPIFAAHGRVDLVYETLDGRLVRAQCKTSRRIGDVVRFSACSNTANQPRDYRGEVDVFCVYSPDLDLVYIVPVEEAPTRAGYLRLTPTRNGQSKGVRWADDYVLGPP